MTHCKRSKGTLFIAAFTMALAMILVGCASPPPTPPKMPVIGRTIGPVLSENPDQAELGSVQYWQICMACHGDVGQGLTDEWREKWGPEEMNCWQSKCHAANHPPWGFDLPRTSAALIGQNTMLRYQNAQELYEKIHATMPWWNPGSLDEQQSWGLTAYLMRANGVLPDGVTLDAGVAAAFPLHPSSAPPGDLRGASLLFAAMLGLGGVALAVEKKLR